MELPSARTEVHRVGDVVVRSTGPWSATVRTVLRHLDDVGFDGAPRVVDDGVEGGRETLTYVEGDLAFPNGWSDVGLTDLGRLLRRFHDAVVTYVAPTDPVWQPWYLRVEGPDAVIGHGDLGPWNIVVRDGMPVGFIDWEMSGPVDHLDEVAQVAWLNVELHADDEAAGFVLSPASERARRLRLFVDAYGVDLTARAEVIDRMIELARRDASAESDRLGGLKIAKSPDGLRDPASVAAWRTRTTDWLVHHRQLLVAALEQ